MQVKKQQLEPDVEQWIGPKLVKEYDKAVYCHLAYLTDMQEYIMCNARLNEAQTGIKTAGRNTNKLRYADDNTLRAESEEELKNLLMKVKEKREKASIKFDIQTTKIMASGSITLWEIAGERMGTVRDFIFLGSKITADGDCSHEIKRCLLLGRKAMTNLYSILKSKELSLCWKSFIVMVFVDWDLGTGVYEKRDAGNPSLEWNKGALFAEMHVYISSYKTALGSKKKIEQKQSQANNNLQRARKHSISWVRGA